MRQLYIRESQICICRIAANGFRQGCCKSGVSSTICAKHLNFYSCFLQIAEFPFNGKNLILIGTARSYLTVILPNVDPGTGGECG